jgi:hypothetical protein
MRTTSYARNSQVPDVVPSTDVDIELLSEDQMIAPVSEACAFQRRLDARLTFSQLRQHVCLDYDLGCVDAKTTLRRLRDLNLLGNPDQFMAVYSAGVLALAAQKGGA